MMASIMSKQASAGMDPNADLPYDPKKYGAGSNNMGSGAGPAIPFKHWNWFKMSRVDFD